MARTTPDRAVIAAVCVFLGAASWSLGLWIGPGPTALNAGKWYLLILGLAGLSVAVIERDLSWTSLAGLYAGQVAAFLTQAVARPAGLVGAEPLVTQPLFIASLTLAAAVGGVVGALATTGGWALPLPDRGKGLDPTGR